MGNDDQAHFNELLIKYKFRWASSDMISNMSSEAMSKAGHALGHAPKHAEEDARDAAQMERPEPAVLFTLLRQLRAGLLRPAFEQQTNDLHMRPSAEWVR